MIKINGLSAVINSKAGAIYQTPLQIFGAGLAAWWDFTDTSIIFQDTARTTAITASGQTVASVTDKSGNGNILFQNTLAYRPTYSIVSGVPRLAGNGGNFMCCANYISSGVNTGHFAYCSTPPGGVLTGSAWGMLLGASNASITINNISTATNVNKRQANLFNLNGFSYKSGTYYKCYTNSDVITKSPPSGYLRASTGSASLEGTSSTVAGNTFRFSLSGNFVNNELYSPAVFAIAEYIIVNGDITDAQVLQLHSYFRFKNNA